MKQKLFKPGDWAWSPAAGKAKITASRNVYFILSHGEKVYTFDGKFFAHDKYRTLLTLSEARQLGFLPTKKEKRLELYVNEYNGSYYGHTTKEIADASAMPGRTGCVRMREVREKGKGGDE